MRLVLAACAASTITREPAIVSYNMANDRSG
jgi:hypothetical protein